MKYHNWNCVETNSGSCSKTQRFHFLTEKNSFKNWNKLQTD